ncbi:unnamed protein product [Cunninghamella blakesleeana]
MEAKTKFKYSYKGGNIYYKYFASNDISTWSFLNFKQYISDTLPNIVGDYVLDSIYRDCLNGILKDYKTPKHIRKIITNLITKLDADNKSDEKHPVVKINFANGKLINNNYGTAINTQSPSTSSQRQEQEQEQVEVQQQQVEEDDLIQNSQDLSFSIPNENDRFVVNDVDISFCFYQFQQHIKNQNDKLYLESHIHHALAISHILLLKPGQHHDDMISIFGENQLDLIINHLNKMFGIKKLPLPLDIITKIVVIIEDVQNKKSPESLAELIKKLPNVAILEETKESELCTRYADPMFTGLFDDPDEDIFFRWTDQTTLETKNNFRLSKRRPDICITSLSGPNWTNNYGFGEAKACSENNNHYSLCKDLLRVGIFSKNSIDIGKMKAVLGIQVVGRSVTFYLSSLLSDGFYVMLEVARVSIPGCINDLLKYLMDMNTIVMVLEVFEKNCLTLSNIQASLHKKRTRPTPTTPMISRTLSNTSCRKRPCVLKYYYN